MPTASETPSPLDPIARYADRRVWVDGDLIPATDAKVSVFDHGLLYGDGVFEGIRIYHQKILKLRTHLERLFDSAKAIRLKLPYTLDELVDATKETVAANGMDNGYIRLVVTRGPGTLGIDPWPCPRPVVFIIVAPIQLYPPEFYEQGLKIVSASTIRNHPNALSPRIKSLNYLNNILAKIEALDAGVLEAVMYNQHGHVAEATADNLFIVRHGTLCTPPLSAGGLGGVTRGIVLELADGLGIPTDDRTDLTRYDLYAADECFLTGTGAEVVPVVEIDRRGVGDGQPGKITKRLIAAFREMVKDAPED